MIISASRRTDIPAFYSDWFFNRLKEGYVLVRNPMNIHQISRILLTPDMVDCFVFWTKNPAQMISSHIRELKGLKTPFYFQFTVNSYGRRIEHDVPSEGEIISTFARLSDEIGSKCVIWRYDPIIITNEFDIDYHCRVFKRISHSLKGYTKKCVISFVDIYKKNVSNIQSINPISPSKEQIRELCGCLSEITSESGIKLVTCAENIDLSEIGIDHGKCIDPELISSLCGGRVRAKKDKNQRNECGCIESIDIGAYNTCGHGCIYCYANYSDAIVKKQSLLHNPNSPLLWGEVGKNDIIVDRKVSSVIDHQESLF